MLKLSSFILLYTFCSITLHISESKAQSKNAKKSQSYLLRLAKLKQEIELNPNNLKSHEEYIDSVRVDSLLISQYNEWSQSFPSSATVPFAIGKYLCEGDRSTAKPYLLKAVSIDPNIADAWYLLFLDAQRWGLFTESEEYIRRAIKANPQEERYQFVYAGFYMDNDYQKFIEYGLKFINTFPRSENAALTLYWMGTRSIDVKTKIKFFELAITKFPPSEFKISQNVLNPYYDALLVDSPAKAEKLSKMICDLNIDVDLWKTNLKLAQQIGRAKKLIAEKKGLEAQAFLGDIQIDEKTEAGKMVILLLAQAYAIQGKEMTAYEILIASFLKKPSKKIKDVIVDYGKRLNKSDNEIKQNIWTKIDSFATPATPFSLKASLGKNTVSLSDYIGKVVLLTYWFPACGPCRAEFPHFESVIKKVNHKDLAYLALNIIPPQNGYTASFLDKTGYSFLSLDDPYSGRRKKGNLDNRGFAPVNFLIDKKGRLIFSNFTIDENNKVDLEEMIKFLID